MDEEGAGLARHRGGLPPAQRAATETRLPQARRVTIWKLSQPRAVSERYKQEPGARRLGEARGFGRGSERGVCSGGPRRPGGLLLLARTETRTLNYV